MPTRIVAVLAFAFAAAPAFAQDDDSDFARTLAQRGWFDLAEEVCDRIGKNSRSTPEARAAVPLVLAEIALSRADNDSNVENSKKYMDDAIALFSKFVKENGAHPRALEARISIGWASGRKAKFLVDALEVAESQEKHGELVKEAKGVFESAERFYREMLDELQKAKSSEMIHNAIMDARLELPRTMLDHGKLPGLDEDHKRKLLEEARKMLEDFEFDYGDRPIAFEGMLLGGQCLLEIGDYKRAEQKLRGTLALKQRLAEAKIQPNDYHKKIIYTSYMALAQMLTRSGKGSEAKALIDQVLRDNKGVEKEWAGLALKLEKVDALIGMRDTGGAAALANEIQKMDPNGRFGTMARKKLATMGDKGGAAISPDQAMTAADGYIDKDQVRDALLSLRRCIEACANEADRTKYWPSAYLKMGDCLKQMRRHYEATLNYEMVCRLYPKDPMAGKACFEASLMWGAEMAVSGDKRDEEQQNRLLQHVADVHKDHPVAKNIPFAMAAKLEASGDIRGAAAKFLTVTDQAEAYETALVRAAYCYATDARQKWAKNPKDAAVQAEVKSTLKIAEDTLLKFIGRLGKPQFVPKEQDAQKARLQLIAFANDQLARIYMHEAVNRTADALKFLELCAKDIPADDQRLAKNWGLQIQAHLAMNSFGTAQKLLDMMFDRFPDGAPIAQAAKSVAIKLDEQTTELIKNKGDAKLIEANLKKISKYYAKWLDQGLTTTRVSMGDVLSVAENLYHIAKQLNGLDDKMVSFLDLKGKTIRERQYFQDAALVHQLLVEGKVGRMSDKERIALMTRLARCYSFCATDATDWDKAKDQYDGIVKAYKLVDEQSNLNVPALQAQPQLLSVYLELGYVYAELGKAGSKFQFDNASTVFMNLLRVAQADSEAWWLCKYMVLEILFERGKDSDIKMAKIGIENLERNQPDYDSGKFGMKDRFLELKAKIDKVMPK